MAVIPGATSIGTGVRYTLVDPGDGIFVLPDNTVMSTDSTAIEADGSLMSVTVAGSVFGALTGISAGDDLAQDSGNSIRVLAGGSVSALTGSAGTAIRVLASNAAVYNEGSISGGYGILIGGSQGGENVVTNRGTISADISAVRQSSGSSDTLVLWNYGSIAGLDADATSFSGEAAPGATSVIYNRGLMRGNILTGDGTDTVDNRDGRVDGDIFLGDGTDSFDNRGGTVTGSVHGDGGNDTFICNPGSAEILDGGDGIDLLDFRYGPGVRLALDDSFDPAGAAAGDEFTGFEDVQGSRSDNDVILGNGVANQLFGNGGDDRLDGLSGNDMLSGGRGIDTLTGGAGNDRFRFHHVADAGDTITDFSSAAAGNNDSFSIVAAGFGGGLSAGGALSASQFQSRADNLAQDADDRFIFRTTDRTLWFDVDGTGAQGAVMVADLQAGALVTPADLLLV